VILGTRKIKHYPPGGHYEKESRKWVWGRKGKEGREKGESNLGVKCEKAVKRLKPQNRTGKGGKGLGTQLSSATPLQEKKRAHYGRRWGKRGALVVGFEV